MKWALTSNDNGLSFWVACCLPVHHTKRFHMAMDIVLVLFASSARNAHDCCAVFAHRAHRSRYRFDSTHFITSKQTVRITDGGTQTFCYKPRQFVVRCCCCWCWFFCFWAFTISIVPGDHFYCCCCYYNIVLFLKNVKKTKIIIRIQQKNMKGSDEKQMIACAVAMQAFVCHVMPQKKTAEDILYGWRCDVQHIRMKHISRSYRWI